MKRTARAHRTKCWKLKQEEGLWEDLRQAQGGQKVPPDTLSGSKGDQETGWWKEAEKDIRGKRLVMSWDSEGTEVFYL